MRFFKQLRKRISSDRRHPARILTGADVLRAREIREIIDDIEDNWLLEDEVDENLLILLDDYEQMYYELTTYDSDDVQINRPTPVVASIQALSPMECEDQYRGNCNNCMIPTAFLGLLGWKVQDLLWVRKLHFLLGWQDWSFLALYQNCVISSVEVLVACEDTFDYMNDNLKCLLYEAIGLWKPSF